MVPLPRLRLGVHFGKEKISLADGIPVPHPIPNGYSPLNLPDILLCKPLPPPLRHDRHVSTFLFPLNNSKLIRNLNFFQRHRLRHNHVRPSSPYSPPPHTNDPQLARLTVRLYTPSIRFACFLPPFTPPKSKPKPTSSSQVMQPLALQASTSPSARTSFISFPI